MQINTHAITKAALGLSASAMIGCGALLFSPREDNKYNAKVEDTALILGTMATLGTMGLALLQYENNRAKKEKLENEFHDLMSQANLLIDKKNISFADISENIDLGKLNKFLTEPTHTTQEVKEINKNLKRFVREFSDD